MEIARNNGDTKTNSCCWVERLP